jgi:hypothetical protein
MEYYIINNYNLNAWNIDFYRKNNNINYVLTKKNNYIIITYYFLFFLNYFTL